MTVWISRCFHCHRYHIPPRLVARFYPCPRCGTGLLS